jgi:hypothetical protein
MDERDEFLVAMADLKTAPCKDASQVVDICTAIPGREPTEKPTCVIRLEGVSLKGATRAVSCLHGFVSNEFQCATSAWR